VLIVPTCSSGILGPPAVKIAKCELLLNAYRAFTSN